MIDAEIFHRDGIVFPAGRIDVTGFAEGYARFQADSVRLRGREIYIKPHLVSTWLDEVVRRPAIIDVVEQIIGPDIVLWESDWSVKRAGTGDYVPWHQDSPYWNLSSDDVTAIRGNCVRDYYALEPRADGEFSPAGLTTLDRALEYPSGFGEARRTR